MEKWGFKKSKKEEKVGETLKDEVKVVENHFEAHDMSRILL